MKAEGTAGGGTGRIPLSGMIGGICGAGRNTLRGN